MDDSNKAPLQSDQKEEKVVVSSAPSDNLTPDHPRFKEVYDKMKAYEEKASEVDSLREQLEALQSRISQPEHSQEDLSYEEQQAIEKIEKALAKKNLFVKKEDWESDRAAEKRSQEYLRLSQVHNGSDGLPKFDPQEVTLFARKNNLGDNLEAAYNLMHMDAKIQLESRKAAQGFSPVEMERPTAAVIKSPSGMTLTSTDIATMSDEEYEQKRAEIHASLKPKKS